MKILSKLGFFTILSVFTFLTTSCDQSVIKFESNDFEISINKLSINGVSEAIFSFPKGILFEEAPEGIYSARSEINLTIN